MSQIVRSGYNNNNNNNNNNNTNRNTKRKKRKTKSRLSTNKANTQSTNINNNNNNNGKQKRKQTPKKQKQIESGIQFRMSELGYESDDSIMDDLIRAPKFIEEEEKNTNLEESIDDDEKMNRDKDGQLNGNANSKRNINRRSLLFDRATNSWFDKNDRFYKFKKLFNDMTRGNEINMAELPKIIIKNIDAVNWSYSDVFNALEEFIKEMKKLGNTKWSEIESDDIVDYRIHIPYNVIPKDLLESQSDENEEKKQQLEQEQAREQNKNENKDEEQDEIEMVNNDKSNKLNEWLQLYLNKVEKEKAKDGKTQDPWDINKPISTQQMITNISNWNRQQFTNHMKVMEKIKIKDINELNGHKKDEMNQNSKTSKCKFNLYLKDFPKENTEGLCWCKTSDKIIQHFKLSQIKIYDDDGNNFDLRNNIDEYFDKQIPNILSRNILRKNRNRISSRFFPTVIPSKSRFDVPKFGYNEYIIDNSAIGFQFGPQAKDRFKRDPNAKQGNLNQTAYIEITLNPSGKFISNNKNWTIELMQKFNKYRGRHFGPNKIKLGFLQSFKMFHIYMDLPKQVFYGPHWNAQVAEFIQDGLERMNSQAFSHRYPSYQAMGG